MKRLWSEVMCRWGWHWWSRVWAAGYRPEGEAWMPVRHCRACLEMEARRADGVWVRFDVTSV